MRHSKKYKKVYYVIPLLLIGAFATMPAYDDWICLSGPHFDVDIVNFLPQGPFWRPIDSLAGFINGKCLFLFPFINHVVVVTAYVYCLYHLKKILLRYGNSTSSFISIALFVVSPALVAGVYSVDAVGQSLSLAFGVASIVYFNKNRKIAFLSMILALFSKESGIMWFCITPLVSFAFFGDGTRRLKSQLLSFIIKPYVVGAFLIALYMILRLSLQTGVIEGESRYSAGIGFNSLYSFLLLIGVSISCIDTVALIIEKNWIIVSVTSIISACFISIVLHYVWKSRKSLCVLLLLLSIIVSCAPYMLMEHPGEMHAINTLWLVSLLLGILIPERVNNYTKYIIGLFFISCFVVYLHKAYYMIDQGFRSWNRTKAAVALLSPATEEVLIIDFNEDGNTYSVFKFTSEKLWAGGKSATLYTKAHNPHYIKYINASELNQVNHASNDLELFNENYDSVWILQGDKITSMTYQSFINKMMREGTIK